MKNAAFYNAASKFLGIRPYSVNALLEGTPPNNPLLQQAKVHDELVNEGD